MFGFLNRGSKDKAGATKARKGSDGFYMELDESKASASENGKEPVAEAVKVETAPAVAAEPAKDKNSVSKSKRAKALETAAVAETKKVEAAPQPVAAKPTAPAAAAKPQTTTFAPDYLLTLTSTNGRRRPGANMSSYLEMARQVKTR